MKIINYKEFDQCFEHYKTMFPDTFTKMDEIIKILNQDYKETGGSGLFGIQVASDCEDRCYGFQFAGDNPYPKYEFVGMTKC